MVNAKIPSKFTPLKKACFEGQLDIFGDGLKRFGRCC
jgi:hypothetical protein